MLSLYYILQVMTALAIGATAGAGMTYLARIYLRAHSARKLVSSMSPAEVQARLAAYAAVAPDLAADGALDPAADSYVMAAAPERPSLPM